jgi:hypothetical protein
MRRPILASLRAAGAGPFGPAGSRTTKEPSPIEQEGLPVRWRSQPRVSAMVLGGAGSLPSYAI